ncbi:3-hydroxyacyl-CoA dehydrogenase [Pollutimonas thiosulfatoxidans]|uniref:3-hydroxyacyl-CoA dehydrogenase n=1 Tax=Pollutimonas thiosulfatoxidans TaxID=2028345 RepID=A0A410GDG4_9BURK|nr:3-hydroxyacyl-CoA dehydrogenase [Pollutimonas thiosulfatoxidans]MBF6617502.1 3-hydroxyacyl-CoA dehydrogenase [Candidimonas sp.]QAA94356.1 3-hydroxyacyl-CoA dehydrogenase [Pollutimonas thiosulfatoxidans]
MKTIKTIGIVGAGAMGRGIAQIAAQAGLDVLLFDLNAAAVAAARESLQQIWDKLVAKEKLSADLAAQSLARVHACADIAEMARADLVIEAVVERLDVKTDLFRQLEGIVSTDCILASNTSSLSITAIAQACERPGRVAGYHFFNPVPLMKVVEVIDGLRSDPQTGDALMALARVMGHTPVRARDMPGFIVNHAGRGMNVEGLKTAQESVAPFYQIDAIMREQAGFRMGPFELLDLTGLDVSHPVMESIYRQFFDEPRFRPSPITSVRSAGKMLGRKTEQGFYKYVDGRKQIPQEPAVPALPEGLRVWLAPYHSVGHKRAAALLKSLGVTPIAAEAPPDDALIVVTPYGEDTACLVGGHQLDGERTVALDTFFGLEQGRRRVVMCSAATQAPWRDAAHALFASDGTPVSVIDDSAGFVAQRIVAAIVNVASDIAQQAIATPQDIDQAVALGLGYPKGGPLSMGDALGSAHVLEILRAMHRVTGDMRYRPSPWLQRRVQLGMSLQAQAAVQAR